MTAQRVLYGNPHGVFISMVDTLPMKQKHYTFFTVFIIIALLMMTSAAWRDYVHTNIINAEVSGSSR